jgi:L-alanine-DL-glutamate epimerase-like enolase superfamily enzyme
LSASRIDVGLFPAALRFSFSHASATRDRTENIIAIAHGTSGRAGYGEGCPRSYVTGETVESAAAFIRGLAPELTHGIKDIDDLKAWTDAHESEIDANPAAFAAVEGALIDLIARDAGVSIETCLGLPPLGGRFRYSAVLGDTRPWKLGLQTCLYRLAGFADFKMKLSDDRIRNQAKLATFGRMAPGPHIRLRVDANNLWSGADRCIEALSGLEASFWALEEPIAAGDIDGCRQIAQVLQVRIILDESATGRAQLSQLAQDPERWILNVRISKMGGIIRSLRFIEEAGRLRLPLVLGAHVGETSLLTRSALTVAHACKSQGLAELLAQEGAFGRILLKEDITPTPLRFGYGGEILANRLQLNAGGGSGLAISSHRLAIPPA